MKQWLKRWRARRFSWDAGGKTSLWATVLAWGLAGITETTPLVLILLRLLLSLGRLVWCPPRRAGPENPKARPLSPSLGQERTVLNSATPKESTA